MVAARPGCVPVRWVGLRAGSGEVYDEGAVVGDGRHGGTHGGDRGQWVATAGVGQDVVELDPGLFRRVGGAAGQGAPAGDEAGESGGQVQVAEEDPGRGQGA